MVTRCCAGALTVVVGAPIVVADTGSAGGSPWATEVASYVQGLSPNPSYLDPTTALGSPERFTGEGSFPGVVSPFNPAFGDNEIVSIGDGGSLTVRFDTPITDDPANPFGIDLIVFGNDGFFDADFPNGVVAPGGATFDPEHMEVEVSDDGVNFVPLGTFSEGFFPTMGYADSGAFDTTPGSVLTNFLKPVDPSLTKTDFAGLTTIGIAALYDGSGGGTGIDIAPSGLSTVTHVRVLNPLGDNPRIEIDGFARVPSPATAAPIALCGLLASRRRG